jgi:hypothetical protein
MLRYGTVVNPDFMSPILNYKSIAKVIKIPVTTVIEIVKFAIQSYNYSFEIGPPNRSKFTQQYIGYLVSPSKLMKSAHISLAKRSQLFHRQFGEKKISPSTIRRIYFKHKIRFKNIKREARERSILPNRITANSSIVYIHSCSRYVNQTHSWCTSMKLCTPSGLSERRDKRKTETEIVSTILI